MLKVKNIGTGPRSFGGVLAPGKKFEEALPGVKIEMGETVTISREFAAGHDLESLVRAGEISVEEVQDP